MSIRELRGIIPDYLFYCKDGFKIGSKSLIDFIIGKYWHYTQVQLIKFCLAIESPYAIRRITD